MTFTKAVATGFRRSVDFSGRSRRPEYWWFFAFVFLGAAVLAGIEAALGNPLNGWLARGFQILVFVPFLAVGWRRLQDTGKPGWYLLIPVAVVVASTLVSGSVLQMLAGLVLPVPTGPAHADAPGWLSLVQVLAGFVIVFWMLRPSQHGRNPYGPEPRVA